jgi:uncharacterized protein (TIGR02145 family)
VIFQVGDDSAGIIINPVMDLIPEGIEYVVLSMEMFSCSGPITYHDTVFIVDNWPLSASAGNDTTVCEGNNVILIATPINGQYPYAYLWNTGWNKKVLNTIPPPGINIYWVQVTDGCGSSYIDTVIVTANPQPVITNPVTIFTLCNGNSTNIVLQSTVPGATFSWTAICLNPNISGYSAGSGPVIAQTLFNSGTTVDTVTYQVTGSAAGCLGPVKDFKVAVIPPLNAIFTPNGQNLCSGSTTGINISSSVPGTTFSWTYSVSSPNITGASSGNGTQIIQTLVNNGFNVDTVTYHVTPSNSGCNGPVFNVKVVVYPVPDVWSQPASEAICSGSSTNLLLSSQVTGASFSWIIFSASPGITGQLPGSGNIIAQTLFNSLTTPGTVTYRATATANGCPAGPSTDIDVTVNPIPQVTNLPANQTICSGTTISVPLTSDVAGATFTWTCTPSSNKILGYSPGSGNLISQTLTDTAFTQQSVIYHVTAIANSCSSPVADHTVFVNPIPDLSNNPLSLDICSGNNTNLTLTSHVAGATFSWTCTPSSANVTGYSPGSGTQINQVLNNLGMNGEFVIYHITPSAASCNGNVTDFTVNVSILPDVFFNPPGQTICSGQTCSIQNLSNVTNTSFSWTATPSSGNLSGFSPGSGPLIAQQLFNSGNTPGTVTYTVTPTTPGCPPGVPQNVIVSVNPSSQVTNTDTLHSICSGTSTNIVLQSTVAGTTFTWTVTASSGNVNGYSAGGGPAIIQTLNNTGFSNEWVIYTVTPHALNCDGPPQDFLVTVFPVPNVIFTPPSQTICSEQTCLINLTSGVSGTSFTWTATGSSPNVSGYGPGSGSSIQQMLTNSGFTVESVTYIVTPAANGCSGISGNVTITLDPLPPIAFAVCNDVTTITTAMPFRLKGGTPLGGTYTGTGVNAGIFYPGLAGPGIHTIAYSYTNMYGCFDNAMLTINVLNPLPFFCNGTLTDVRDNRQYPTVQIGTQCWMAANLNYGSPIASSAMQRDNCQIEKYCYNDNPLNCTTRGGYYQWDELMHFEDINAGQGLCPPGWHVPSETDWNILFAVYISSGFAGSPLKFDGFSGYNAYLYGTRFINKIWSFDAFATMLWSSTSRGPTKAWAHGMNIYNPSVSYYPAYRMNAFQVRCVRD